MSDWEWIDRQVGQLTTLIEGGPELLAARAERVSDWTVGQQLEHILLVGAAVPARLTDPDYDPRVGRCRLAYNQSSATVGVAVEILGAVGPAQLPDLIDAATEERAVEIVRERYDDPAEAQRVLDGLDGGEGWYGAAEEALGERGGYVVAEADGETGELTGDWYLVQTLDRAGR